MKDVIKLKRHDEFTMRFSMGKLYKTICETLLDKGVLKIERVDDREEVRYTWELKEQEVRELTMDEWREWKNNPKRNPICKLWEHDTSPMWVLNPNDVHEPALLMGKLKLFTGKPTFEQCRAVKWGWKF